MSELSPGNWQPWDLDGSRRHQCDSGTVVTPSPSSPTTNAETYLTRCPWCTQHVYYHTNGHNDCVYFDTLGYPWQIHACWEKYWQEQKDRNRVLGKLSETGNFDQQRLLILAGAMRTISTTRFLGSIVYNIREATLAQQMGLSITELRTVYGHLYSIEANGIKLKLNSQTSNASTKRNLIEIDEETGKVIITSVPCNHCHKWFPQEQLMEHFKAAHYVETTPYSNCNERIKARKMRKGARERKEGLG